MKIRQDFVTNSSSSSFVIAKKYLDKDQILALKEHSYLAEKLGFNYTNYEWNIKESEYYIAGDMYIDNFDMYNFMKFIGIDLGHVTWGEYPFDISKMPSPSELENQDNWREILHNKRKKFFPKKIKL